MQLAEGLTGGRFVILEHDFPFQHWDLLLEMAEAARTWRLLSQPEAGPQIPAELLADHRLLYLSYEGPISGNRGCVRRVCAGTYVVAAADDQSLQLRLQGTSLGSSARLHCDPLQGCRWTFSR